MKPIQAGDHAEIIKGALGGCGKIVFAQDGETFFVAGGAGVARFNVHDSSGTAIITEGPVEGMFIMPNGDLLVAANYELKRYTTTGTLVSTIAGADQQQLTDPLKLVNLPLRIYGNDEIDLVDPMGIAYETASNTIFMSMLGYTSGASVNRLDMRYKVMAVDSNTLTLKAIVTYSGLVDVLLTKQGRLLISSDLQAPSGFDTNLQSMIAFGGGPASFLALMPSHEDDDNHADSDGSALDVRCWRSEKARSQLKCGAQRSKIVPTKMDHTNKR